MPLLELSNIVKKFPVRSGFFGHAKEFVHAVDGVSLFINKGETLGLVGESGCGKTTLARIAARLIPCNGGDIIFKGEGITHLAGKRLLPFRRQAQMIFQDPFSSLNPRMSVGDIILEPLRCHERDSRVRGNDRVIIGELLESVGLEPDFAQRYPHEFSGGQRQRICIARALALKPELIIADEPVSSLDVAVQAEIMELLKKLQREFNLAYLFISHDLRVVRHFSHRVAVMQNGRIVEEFPADKMLSATHPYTRMLLSSVPVPDPTKRLKRVVI